jgi:parvulin-like peptidyl-prolyl isomerase
MSVMEKMRGSTDSTPMQVVLILIVIAFIGWVGLPQGESVNVALQVNGERVLMSEFGPRYHMAKALEQAGDRDLTDERERELMNILKQRIARDLVLAQEARRLGYQVSAEEISRVIKSDPRYFDENGKFDVLLWKDSIKASGRSRADHEDVIRREVLRDKLMAAIAIGAVLDERATRREYNELLSTVDIDVIELHPSAVEDRLDEVAFKAWEVENADRVRAEYDRIAPARYETPEKVGLQVIRLLVDGNGEEVRERLAALRESAAGGDFAAVARASSEDAATSADGGDLGERTVLSLVARVRDAIADLQVGEVSDIVDEGDRMSIFRLRSRQEAHTVPFEAVRASLARSLYLEDVAQRWAREIATSWDLDVPAERMNEMGATFDVLRAVSPMQYDAGPDRPPLALVQAAKKAVVGEVLEPVSVPAGQQSIWYVGKVRSFNEADDGLYTYFRSQKLREVRAAAIDRYAADLQAKSQVDTGEGTVMQGGWRDWLAGILPNSQ